MKVDTSSAEQILFDHVKQIAETRYQLREEIYEILPLLPENIAASLKDKVDRSIAPRPKSRFAQLFHPESLSA